MEEPVFQRPMLRTCLGRAFGLSPMLFFFSISRICLRWLHYFAAVALLVELQRYKWPSGMTRKWVRTPNPTFRSVRSLSALIRNNSANVIKAAKEMSEAKVRDV